MVHVNGWQGERPFKTHPSIYSEGNTMWRESPYDVMMYLHHMTSIRHGHMGSVYWSTTRRFSVLMLGDQLLNNMAATHYDLNILRVAFPVSFGAVQYQNGKMGSLEKHFATNRPQRQSTSWPHVTSHWPWRGVNETIKRRIPPIVFALYIISSPHMAFMNNLVSTRQSHTGQPNNR